MWGLCCCNFDAPIHKNRWSNPALYKAIDSLYIKPDNLLDPLTFAHIFIEQKYSLKGNIGLQSVVIKFCQFRKMIEQILNES